MCRYLYMNKSTHYLVNDDISPHGFFKSVKYFKITSLFIHMDTSRASSNPAKKPARNVRSLLTG